MKFNYLLIISIVIFFAGCRNRKMTTADEEEIRVKVAEVKKEKISIPLHVTGMLTSSEEMKLSFKTGGIVAKINVSEGIRVKKGDILALLNLSEIEANADQAENFYEKALRDFTRADNLYRDSVATLEQRQNAATALNSARSGLEIARFNLSHSKIVAPDDGVILKQFIRQNEMVSSGYPVFLFGSTGKYWKVKAGLSDRDVVKVNMGDSAVVSFDAYPGIDFRAVVCQVGEFSNPFTGTYETELLVNRSDFRLASGFVADVNIFPVSEKVLSLIPIGAIVEADGNNGFIYTVNETLRVNKIMVTIITVIGTDAAVEGIPGDMTDIVSEGAAYLREGVKVKVIK
jgi:membrane fusion protein, multidrug efflux system